LSEKQSYKCSACKTGRVERIGVEREGILDNEMWCCKRCGIIYDNPEEELDIKKDRGRPIKALTREQLTLAREIFTGFGFVPDPSPCLCQSTDFRFYITGGSLRGYCNRCRRETIYQKMYHVWSGQIAFES
jgi:hypothetical protein